VVIVAEEEVVAVAGRRWSHPQEQVAKLLERRAGGLHHRRWSVIAGEEMVDK
jgi:hypothetical protein